MELAWMGGRNVRARVRLQSHRRAVGRRLRHPGRLHLAGVPVIRVHPTVAGVILGLLTPAQAWIGQRSFAGVLEAAWQRVAGDRGAICALHRGAVMRSSALRRRRVTSQRT